MGPLLAKQTRYRPSYRTRYLQTDGKDPEFLTCLLYPEKALLCNESGPSLWLNHPCISCLSFEALGQHFHSKLKIESAACICLQVEFCPQISSVNAGTASSVQQSTYLQILALEILVQQTSRLCSLLYSLQCYWQYQLRQ